ncbi:MAG: SDR family oxidoreductase [Clostridia bacterium]|nr:SDR family oxidoreductase [Clostridia bacterium]
MKTVLITGASGGIGSAAARAFHAAGHFVVLHYFKNESAADELRKELPHSAVFRADLRDPAQISALADAFPETDVLVNNAGVELFSLFDLVTEEQEKNLYDVNLLAPIRLTRRLLKPMLARRSGVILNVSSYFGEIGGSCETDYSAAKAGLIGFTKALAKEVGPSGIRVNCVCPGIIRTPMNDRLTAEEEAELTESIPLDRFGTADEVARTLVFLAGEDASYITGAVLDVNGGIL